jgi:hypothetical protein
MRDTIEVLRLSKDGIWANPEIPADDAAKLVLEAIDDNIKILVQKAVLAEREACAKVCEDIGEDLWALYKGRAPYTGKEEGRADMHVQGKSDGADECAAAIRARGNT